MGFTLIELLVVIAIIGILASIGITTYNGALQRTRAVKMLSDFRELEGAFKQLYLVQGRQEWWTEGDLTALYGVSGNPTIESFADASGLSEFISDVPTAPIGTVNYSYDNDNDVKVCNQGNPYDGVNLFIRGGTTEMFTILDNMVDEGNGTNCGTITYDGDTLLYHISDHSTEGF